MTLSDSPAGSSLNVGDAAPSQTRDASDMEDRIPTSDQRHDDQVSREAQHPPQEEWMAEGPDIDAGWAWVVCLASFFANFILDGVLFSIGILHLELLDYFEDTKSKTAWVGSTLLGFSIAMGPVVSLLLEFCTCRQVMILGSLVSTAGFLLSAFATNVETLIFTYGVIGGSGFGLSFVTAILVVGLHFNKKRALATGIAMSGSGVGTFAVSYMTERLIEWYGWQGTMFIIAGLVLNCCVCGALMRPLVTHDDRSPPCCPSNRKKNCCKKNLSQDTVEHEQSLLREKGWSVTPVITINPAVKKPFLTSADRLVADDKKSRLYHSNDQMFLPLDVSDRRYKSDIHLHNFRPIAPALDIDTHVTRHVLRTPLQRKDIFYSGSIYNLPEYKKDPNMNSFLKSMASLHSNEDNFSQLGDFSETAHDSQKKHTFISAHKELLCDKLFLMLLFVMTAWTGHASVLTCVPDLAVSKGVSNTQAALLVSAVGVANIIGRLFAGWLTNRPNVDSVIVYTCAILLAGVVSAVFPLCTSFPVFVVCSSVFGLCMASCVSLRTVVLADTLGVSKLTKAFGIVAFLQGIAFTVGPPISGALYDWSQSFLPPFLLAAGMYILSGVTCALVRPAQRWFNKTSCLRVESDDDIETSEDMMSREEDVSMKNT